MKLLFTLMIVAAVFFFLDRGGFLGLPRAVFESIVSPAAHGLHEVAFFSPFSNSQTKKLMIERNDLEEKLVEFEKIKKENDDLRFQLGINSSSSPQNKNLMIAGVLSTSHFFIIDKGADDGLKDGQNVVFKNIFIGKVNAVGRKTARVLLPIDEGSVLAVKTLGSGALGLIKGKGEEAILSDVILSENLSEDDTVLTVGSVDEQGLGVRPGLLVGKIVQIRKSEDGLYQEAKLLPLIDFKSLENVFVLF